jgi:BlaI family transcriptional regulator, penicillinase repressor
MNVLWADGPANVQTVQSHLRGASLAYTTVQTMLNVLHRKGRVKRELKNRAYVYRPVYSRQKAVSQAIGEMLDRFFGGSADSLVLSLVETRHLTPEKLAEIQKSLEKEVKDGND